MNIAEIEIRIKQLHHLPLTTLEQHLKRCRSVAVHNKKAVLTGQEMLEYILWMSENFGKNSDLNFLINDISIISGGTIAQTVASILKNGKKDQIIKQMNGIFSVPSEKHFFADDQNISCSRFLRHMPSYWQSSEYFEIYYVFSGQCPVWFKNEKLLLSPGSVLLIPPGIRKATACPEDDCVMFFYMIRSSTFSKVFWEQISSQNLMGNFFQNALKGGHDTSYLLFETGGDPGIELLLYSIYAQYTSDGSYRSFMVNSLMQTFFVSLLQGYEQTARMSKQSGFHWKPEFSEIFAYIQDHYQTVTLKELSRQFNYSQRQLIRIIESSTSKTFSGLVTQLRMEKAASMLKAGNYSVEEIAAETGYHSLSSFYRAFTEQHGMPPVKWRKFCRSDN